MANLVEIKALVFALVGGSPAAKGEFLNQNLAIRSTSVLRGFHAYFLGALSLCLLDLVHEPRDRLRLVKFYDHELDGVRARTDPARGSRGRSVRTASSTG
jgi:hypothetical protein